MKPLRTLAFTAAFIATGAVAQGFTPPAASLAGTPSGTYTLDKTHANIIFGINHLGFSTYYGRFDNFDATLTFDAKDPTKSSLNVTIDTASTNTNNKVLEDKLDSKVFFNTAQFPKATFVSKKLEKTSDTTGKLTGDLTLLGVTKPVTLDVTFNASGLNPFSKSHTLGFGATGMIKRSDFGMKEYLPAVGDEVVLQIQAEFAQAPAKN